MENWTRLSDDELHQRHQDNWARGILACPNPACRRRRRCTLGVMACPALKADPIPPEHTEDVKAVIYRLLQERAAEISAGPEAKAAGDARRDREDARRKALAFKRARGGRGGGR
jgi:hypothetical protein